MGLAIICQRKLETTHKTPACLLVLLPNAAKPEMTNSQMENACHREKGKWINSLLVKVFVLISLSV